MNIRAGVLAGALAAVPFQNAAQHTVSLDGVVSLRVHVYNLANVQAKSLERALRETARILAVAGIEIVFEPGSADSPEAHTSDMTQWLSSTMGQKSDDRDFLVVRMVRGFPAEVLPKMLGFSLPSARKGVHATVFYDRVERVNFGSPAPPETVLGSVLAHEIGHVLLRSGEHTSGGIMKAVWNRGDYQRMAEGTPEFQLDQAVAMREEVRRRVSTRTLTLAGGPY